MNDNNSFFDIEEAVFLTLQQINYLLTISESRSMDKAAEKLKRRSVPWDTIQK